MCVLAQLSRWCFIIQPNQDALHIDGMRLSVVPDACIRKVAQALEYLVLLLDPPLVIEADAIKEVPIQDDHLVVVEEEDAKAIVK